MTEIKKIIELPVTRKRKIANSNIGTVLGPSGMSMTMEQIIEHNRRNREKIRARLGHWYRRFKIGESFRLRGTNLEVREIEDDILIFGPPKIEDGWHDEFAIGQIFPLRGYEFMVIDIYYNSLHMICRGETGKARKLHART